MSIQTIYRTEFSVAFIPENNSKTAVQEAQDELLEFEDALENELFDFTTSGGIIASNYNSDVWQAHIRLEHKNLPIMESTVKVVFDTLAKYPKASLNTTPDSNNFSL